MRIFTGAPLPTRCPRNGSARQRYKKENKLQRAIRNKERMSINTENERATKKSIKRNESKEADKIFEIDI